MTPKVLSVVGARPNFMKVEPVHRVPLASEADIAVHIVQILAGGGTSGQVPPLWDGRAARRIVEILEEALAS